MRSRLEARWSVFFDALGLAWRYQIEGFDLGAAGRLTLRPRRPSSRPSQIR